MSNVFLSKSSKLIVLSIVFLFAAESSAQNPVNSTNPFFVKKTIWKYLEDGYLANHVHALVISPKGTLVAFSEGRIGPYDGDPSNLISKRSTDNGETWSDDTLIERSDGRFYEGEGVEG